MVYDLVIIGAGPAGLAAALDAEYLRLKTLVLEAGRAGGALIQSYPWKGVDSYLGFNGMNGKEVAEIIVKHAKSAGADIHEMEAVEEVKRGRIFRVKTDSDEYEAKTVIFATGIMGVPMKLSAEGGNLEGIVHSVKDPKKFSGKNVLVVGGGDFAADCALGLDEAGARVWMAHRKDQLRATDDNREKISKSGIEMLWCHEVEKFSGDDELESATLFSNKSGKKTTLELDAAVICIGSVPTRDCIQNLGVKIEKTCVKINDDCMTSVPGIFAAGDIVADIKRIPQALATGEKAVYSAYKYLKNPYWK